MSDDPSWDDIFGPGTEKRLPQQPPALPAAAQRPAAQPAAAQPAAAQPSDPQPVAAQPPAPQSAAAQPSAARPVEPQAPRRSAVATAAEEAPPSRRAQREPAEPRPRRPRKKRRWGLLVFFLIFLLIVGGTGVAVWNTYGQRIQQALGWESTDYSGSGDGTEVDFVINSGDIGETIARNLAKDGITKTFTAPYKILLKDPTIRFDPGTYKLQKQMSAASAIAALQDAKNRLVNKAVIPEGSSAEQAFTQLSAATKIPVADFEAAAKDYVALGVPAQAPSIEGFLFPATYTFDPGVTAPQVLKLLVTTMNKHLDADGVPQDQRFRIVTLASIVQKEAGSTADMPKIARVFQNRLDKGMNLQSDATVAYGAGTQGRVTTTNAERADAANKYNTYANPGLPIGPIGLPGDAAIKAALHPADGAWLYFVAVNLKTGETVFSTTAADHAAAVKQWQAWCKQSAENAAYCK